jgi:hypothetical protein
MEFGLLVEYNGFMRRQYGPLATVQFASVLRLLNKRQSLRIIIFYFFVAMTASSMMTAIWSADS